MGSRSMSFFNIWTSSSPRSVGIYNCYLFSSIHFLIAQNIQFNYILKMTKDYFRLIYFDLLQELLISNIRF